MKNLILAFFLFLSGCTSMNKNSSDISDETIWLEAIDSKEVLDWVKKKNEPSVRRLESISYEGTLRQEALNILNSDDRIPAVTIRGNWVYNFWTDKKNPRGLFRRALYADYIQNKPNWEILIDIDQLNQTESKSWVFRGCSFFKPDSQTCLMSLSDAGRDAFEPREFNLATKAFVNEKTFNLPVGKHRIAWSDENTLLVATDFEKDSLSSSGYPLRVRLWKRGEDLLKSKIVFEAKKSDMMVWNMTLCRPEGCFRFLTRMINFYEVEMFLVSQNGDAKKFDLPLMFDVQGVFKNEVYISLKKDLKTDVSDFLSGDLVKFPIDNEKKLQLVFRPSAEQSFQSIRFGQNKIYMSILENVLPKIMRNQEIWSVPAGNVYMFDIDPYSDRALITTESPVSPTTLFEWVGKNKKQIRSLPKFFNSSDIEVLQKFANSADGQKISYFLIRKKGPVHVRPTIVNAYGGFQIAQFPGYEPIRGKLWLEAGGQYVVANIRGGGEYGPKWHQSALKENRQRAFDDLFAVTADVQKQGYANPQSTGFVGGSNGGLLAGVAMTQRPDLYGAIVSQVPLLDMKRFHKLLAGHSWTAEYGNPDNAAEWEYIQKYSPLHNLRPQVKYPNLFLMTSTRDDRVHPAHARKFAYQMDQLGYQYDYFENIEGGHGGAADNTQRAKFVSLMYTFFREKLGLQ